MTDPNDHELMSRAIKGDAEFERILVEYKIVIQQLKARCVKKYGIKARKWFGI